MSEIAANKYLLKILLDFLYRDYMEQEIRVEIISDAPRIFTTEGFIELVKGAEYILPRRIAYELAAKGIVKIKDEELTLESLSKIVYNEEATQHKPQLSKISPFIYFIILRRLGEIEKKLRSEGSLELFEEYRNITDLYTTLMKIRVRKLLSILQMIEVPQDTIEKMSEEEKILFGLMRSTLKEWKKKLGIEKG